MWLGKDLFPLTATVHHGAEPRQALKAGTWGLEMELLLAGSSWLTSCLADCLAYFPLDLSYFICMTVCLHVLGLLELELWIVRLHVVAGN